MPVRACSNGPATPAAQYTYYLAAALLAGNDGAKKKYLWWGRYLTMFQMFQVCQTSRLTIHKAAMDVEEGRKPEETCAGYSLSP